MSLEPLSLTLGLHASKFDGVCKMGSTPTPKLNTRLYNNLTIFYSDHLPQSSLQLRSIGVVILAQKKSRKYFFI